MQTVTESGTVVARSAALLRILTEYEEAAAGRDLGDARRLSLWDFAVDHELRRLEAARWDSPYAGPLAEEVRRFRSCWPKPPQRSCSLEDPAAADRRPDEELF